MSFQPVIPFGGTAGWAFLQRTKDTQQAAFAKSPVIQRDADYFRDNIGKIDSARDLVDDYRLMKVALGAFGLDDDLPNKAYIEKVLSEGSLAPDAFANKLVDKRYLALAQAFNFDLGTPSSKLSDFADKILASYEERQFEIAVGNQNPSMRVSLALERDLSAIVEGENSNDGRWYAVMGNPPLRQVFEKALGFPASFGTIDLDLQMKGFRDRAQTVFGVSEVKDFGDPEMMGELNRMYLVRSQIDEFSSVQSAAAIALTLLQNMGR